MDFMTLLKQRASTRLFKKKNVSKRLIDTILEAGKWGPSIHHFQPWRFVIIRKKFHIDKIAKLTSKEMERNSIPDFIIHPTLNTLKNARVLICVYNTKIFSFSMKRFNPKIFINFELAEICAIAACVQNMILEIENLGLGSCWLDMPLFCRNVINRLLNQRDELIAVLALGYPRERGSRSPRSGAKNLVSYL